MIVWKRESVNASNQLGLRGLIGLSDDLFFGFGLTDENFNLIITKPDNVPIVSVDLPAGLLSRGFRSGKAVAERPTFPAAGDPLIEKDEEDRVWTWPDLVYTELIAMVVCAPSS